MNDNPAVPQVDFAAVSKSYGPGRPILDSIDLVIKKGEFVTLIGPSGCGKSTILKLIAGLTAPTEGIVEIDGMAPADARAATSFVFQDPTLLPWRTVRKNVGLGLELEGATKGGMEDRVNAELDLVGLSHVADAYPRQLSGGMKMRTSIARALCTSPRLLLMDEPFAALDEMTRDRLNEEVLRLREERQWTCVFVTHSVAEAVFLSTRIVVLAPNPGRVHASLPIDFEGPRTASLRESDEFEDVVAYVSRALREALAA